MQTENAVNIVLHAAIIFTWLLLQTKVYLSLVRFKGHFPGGPGLAGTRLSPVWILLELRVMEVVSGDNRNYMTNKAPVKMSPPANQHTYLYRPDALRIHGPTNHVKALKGN